jgi:hypothetical protein
MEMPIYSRTLADTLDSIKWAEDNKVLYEKLIPLDRTGFGINRWRPRA